MQHPFKILFPGLSPVFSGCRSAVSRVGLTDLSLSEKQSDFDGFQACDYLDLGEVGHRQRSDFDCKPGDKFVFKVVTFLIAYRVIFNCPPPCSVPELKNTIEPIRAALQGNFSSKRAAKRYVHC